MQKKIRLLLLQEIIWIVIALVISSWVVLPLYLKLNYVFIIENFLLVFYAIMLVRLVLFFRNVPWLKPTWVRFVLFIINLNLFIFITRKEQNFISIYDSFAIDDLGKPKMSLSLGQIEKLYHYFYLEINLTVVACLVLIFLFCGRLIHSYWSLTKTRLYVDVK